MDPRDDTRAAGVLERVFRSAYVELYAHVRRFVRDRARAEEIIQDAFLAAWGHRASWRTVDELRPYVFTTARHLALNHLRHERVELTWRRFAAPSVAALDGAAAPADSPHREEVEAMVEEVRAAVASLTPRVRHTMILRLQWHLTNAEIAEVMRISVKAVERNVARGCEALRGMLSRPL